MNDSFKIGQIVFYIPTDEDNKLMNKTGNTSEKLPAIVVATWSDTVANIKVFADGTIDLWKTSVHLGNNPGEFKLD